MRKIIIMLFTILSIFTACKRVSNIEPNESEPDNSPFCPVLRNEICKMMDENRKINSNKLYKVFFFKDRIKRKEECIVTIGLGIDITPMIKFDPSSRVKKRQTDSIKRMYTFLHKELVVCYIVSESCSNTLIDEKKLIPVQDSIPGYPDALKAVEGRMYDAPTKVYKVINKDSLQLIKSTFV